jgi:AbiU2
MPEQKDAPPPSKDLMDAFELVEDDLLWLHAKWKVYRQLFGTSEERINILNNFAPDFFQIVHDSVLYDTLMTLSRLTDPDKTGGKENLSIKGLIKMLYAQAYDDLASQVVPLSDTATKQCDPLRAWRNRLIAHKDLGTAMKFHADPLPDVSRQMVEEALVTLRTLMSHIHLVLKKSETDYADVPLRGDGNQIVYYLKEAAAYHEHRIHGRVDPVEDGVVEVQT